MSPTLSQIIAALNLGDEPTLAVAHGSAGAPPITDGAALVLLDDPGNLRVTLKHYPPEHRLRILTSSGTVTDASVHEVLSALPSDAVALALAPIASHEIRDEPAGVRGVIDCLRDPVDGCPWDNAQTHQSLRPHLLEETYEVLEAIGSGDPTELCEELGDLMMQVVLHAKLAEQAGDFTLDDVAEGIRAKLVRRHPHVFGDGLSDADTPKLVEGAWERLKRQERPERESVLDGVPKALPALARAQSILGRAERNGFSRDSSEEGDLGDRLLDLVQAARDTDLSAEDALRDALARFEASVRAAEATRGSTA